MNEDRELLAHYATDHSEPAFEELVRRNINLVYSAAIRLLNGDVHRAQDVTQQVFAELARQARNLARHPALVGWLYTTARRIASRTVRTEQRRAAREKEACAMNEILGGSNEEPKWEELKPVLDDAMHELREQDRLAVLLRFFQDRSFSEVGAALGLSENSARMRVNRALDKLRLRLARKGVTSTTAALALLLKGNAVEAAPPALIATLTGASLTGAAAGSGVAFALCNMGVMTTFYAGITVLAAAGAATAVVVQHDSQTKMREENEALRQEVAALYSPDRTALAHFIHARPHVHLPAPSEWDLSSRLRPESDISAEWFGQVFGDGILPQLTPDQLRGYLDENHRSAASLLAAFRTTGDAGFLEEAMETYPSDPLVAYESVLYKDASPADRRRRLDVFKESAPDNVLANYLSAFDYFGSGETNRAIEDLLDALEKPRFDDYLLHRWHAIEEAYRSAGFDGARATTAATWATPLEHGRVLRQFCGILVDLARAYRQAGDEDAARVVLHMTLGMAEHLRSPRGDLPVPSVQQLVAIEIEGAALSEIDPAELYDGTGKTIQDRLEHIGRRGAEISEMSAQISAVHHLMTPQDWSTFNARTRSLGEENAIEWLVKKYGRD